MHVNIKDKCSDKRTNTSKHEFAEKEVSVIIRRHCFMLMNHYADYY